MVISFSFDILVFEFFYIFFCGFKVVIVGDEGVV